MIQPTQQQYEVRFRIGDDRHWFADEGRDLVGRLFSSESPDAIALICHHQAADPQAAIEPCFRYKGGNGFFSIVALGKPSIELLQSVEHRIRRRLSESFHRPIRTESLDTSVAITRAERMRFYRAHVVIFARKHRAMKTLFSLSEEDLRDYLGRMLLRDLRTQAEQLGLEIPSESLPFQILDVGRRVPVPLNKPGQRLYVGSVKYIDFMSTLELKGHWAVGGLQNRGHGSIRPLRSFQKDKRPAINVSGVRYATL